MAIEKLRLLHISPYAVQDPLLGGVPQSVKSLCDALCQSGHRVTLWASDVGRANLHSPELGDHGVRTRLFHSRLKILGTVFNSPIVPELMLVNPSAMKEFDLVHMHGYWSSFTPSVARACRSAQIPLVLQPRGSLVESNQKQVFKNIYQALFHREIIAATTIAVALTEVERRQLLSAGFADSRVRVIPNFVSPPSMSLPPPDAARRTLGLPAEAPLILYLGRLHPMKGLRELLVAFARVKQGIPEATLAVAGPDDGMLTELRALAQEVAPRDIFFLGPLDNSRKWMAFVAANVFCLPSAFEAFPRVVLEAAAAGIPTVLSSRVMLPQLLESEGVVSADPNPDELASSITRLLLDPSLRARTVRNARRCVEDFFSERAVISLMESAYESAVKTPSA